VTIPTFTTYTPPDVYVADVTTPIITAPGVAAQVMAIVGPALGYRTANESFLLYSATGAQLSFQGVFTTAQVGPPPIAAPVVTTVTGVVLTQGVDYSFTVTPDASGNPALSITAIARVATSPNISDGSQITIVYNYADITYYRPQVFTDFQSVLNAYGPPLVSVSPTTSGASQVANPLSFAAQIAFTNTANTIIALALNPSVGNLQQQLQAAYAQLSTYYQATIIVPVFTDDLTPTSGTVSAYAATLAGDLKAACLLAASNGYPRIGIFGLPRNYSESAEPIVTLASSLKTKRIVLAYPEIVQVFNGLTGQVFNASGCYLAVALGATLTSLPVNTGLTRQSLDGFTGLTQAEIAAMTTSTLNAMAAAGTCIVYADRNGALTCRHGLTTDMSALNNREVSLVRQADTLLMQVAAGMENSGLIGEPITPEMPAIVEGALTSILEQCVNTNIINSWSNLTISQETFPSGDPTIIDCAFTYVPAIPLNYVQVTFSIDLTSGLVATQSAQNAAAA